MALDRQTILDAALELTRQEGLAGLSQRKLAAELGVSAMAMYRHFRDKDAIVHALLDHVIDPDALLAGGDDLEEGLVQTFVAMRALFLEDPALAPLAGTPASLGLNGLRFLEALLAWMQDLGVEPDRGARLVQATLSYTLGASLVAAGAASTDALEAARERFADLDIAEHPTLLKAAPTLLGFVGDDQFEKSLRVLIRASLAE